MTVKISKLNLSKTGETARLSLAKSGSQEMVINLNWSRGGGGFKSSVDLDLGVFYELAPAPRSNDAQGWFVNAKWSDGQFYHATVQGHAPAKAGGFLGFGSAPESFLVKWHDGSAPMTVPVESVRCFNGVIDGIEFAKGTGGPRHKRTNQGCYTEAPWIWHSGDDRSGASSDGENVLINPDGFPYIQRILVYAYIYEGVARWHETNAVVTVRAPTGDEVSVDMGAQSDKKKTCAIAGIQFSGGEMSVHRLVSFHDGKKEMDDHYKFGFRWGYGSK